MFRGAIGTRWPVCGGVVLTMGYFLLLSAPGFTVFALSLAAAGWATYFAVSRLWRDPRDVDGWVTAILLVLAGIVVLVLRYAGPRGS